MAEMRDLGVGEVLCSMNFGGLPAGSRAPPMELFAREVLPKLWLSPRFYIRRSTSSP
jgi:hypothetical protein